MRTRAPGWSDLTASGWNFLAFGCGSGLSPAAPGTFGSLAALPLFWALHELPLAAYLAAVGLLGLVGVLICGRAASYLGVHDHPAIVWDEVVGMLLALSGVPAEAAWVLLGFVLFRILDILKPWPIRWCDRRVAGGLGIMLDDVLAGGLAAALLHLAMGLTGNLG